MYESLRYNMTPERMTEIDEAVEYFYERTGIDTKPKVNRFHGLTSEERINRMIEISNHLIDSIKRKQS